jgi:hypothetical protein
MSYRAPTDLANRLELEAMLEERLKQSQDAQGRETPRCEHSFVATGISCHVNSESPVHRGDS